jgi:hypothetical protein
VEASKVETFRSLTRSPLLTALRLGMPLTATMYLLRGHGPTAAYPLYRESQRVYLLELGVVQLAG